MNNEEKKEEYKINNNNKGWREWNLWNKIKNDTQHERTITNCITISQSHVDFTCYAMWCAQKKIMQIYEHICNMFFFVSLKLILFAFLSCFFCIFNG